MLAGSGFRTVQEMDRFIEFEAAGVSVQDLIEFSRSLGLAELRICIDPNGVFSLDSVTEKRFSVATGETVESKVNVTIRGYLDVSVFGRILASLGVSGRLFSSDVLKRRDEQEAVLDTGAESVYVAFAEEGVYLTNLSSCSDPVFVPFIAMA